MVYTHEFRAECNRRHKERREQMRVTRTEIFCLVAMLVLFALAAGHV